MHNAEKWPNILENSWGVQTTRFLKYVWPFFDSMHENVNSAGDMMKIGDTMMIIIFVYSLNFSEATMQRFSENQLVWQVLTVSRELLLIQITLF